MVHCKNYPYLQNSNWTSGSQSKIYNNLYIVDYITGQKKDLIKKILLKKI